MTIEHTIHRCQPRQPLLLTIDELVLNLAFPLTPIQRILLNREVRKFEEQLNQLLYSSLSQDPLLIAEGH